MYGFDQTEKERKKNNLIYRNGCEKTAKKNGKDSQCKIHPNNQP